jgi:hypothetical protein
MGKKRVCRKKRIVVRKPMVATREKDGRGQVLRTRHCDVGVPDVVVESASRRDISYDADIVEDVYRQFNGSVSRTAIGDVIECAVDYIHQLMEYDSALVIKLGGLGWMAIREKDAKKKMYVLNQTLRQKSSQTRTEYFRSINRPEWLTPETIGLMMHERNALRMRLEKLEKIRRRGEEYAHPFFRNKNQGRYFFTV